MRKLFLVTLVLFVAAGMVAAQEVTITGGVQQAWGFGDNVYSAGDAPAGDIDLDFSVDIDGVNTAVIKLENGPAFVDIVGLDANTDATKTTADFTGEALVEIDEAYFDTDLATALGLEGLIVQTRVGYWEADIFDVSTVTGLEFEDAAGVGAEVQALQFEAGVTDLVKARFVVVPGEADALNGLIAIKGGYGPIEVEVFYVDALDGSAPADEGLVGGGIGFSQELVPGTVDLSAGGDVWFDLDAASGASDLFYGVGVSAGLLDGLSTVGISFGGQSEYPADALGFDVNLAPVEFAGLDVAVALGIDDRYTETLQYSEFSFYLVAGAATFRVGYAFYDGPKVTDEDGDALLYSDYKAGLFIAEADSGFAFFNTEIEF